MKVQLLALCSSSKQDGPKRMGQAAVSAHHAVVASNASLTLKAINDERVERSDHFLSHGGNTFAVSIAEQKTRLLAQCLDQSLSAGAGGPTFSSHISIDPAEAAGANAAAIYSP
jgi:hypothetical protein